MKKIFRNDIALFIFLLLIYSVTSVYFYKSAPLEVGWDYYSWKNIALKYSSGHFKEALNAYWSPLVSWLMIPLVKAGLFDHKENLVINLFAGVFLILLAFKISYDNNLTRFPKLLFILSVFFFSIGLPVLFYDFCDFSAAVAFIAYITFISSPHIKTHKHYYILCGVLGLLCLFGKSFYTYFVILNLLLLLLYNVLFQKEQRGYALQNIWKTLVIVLIGVSVWAILLSWKYERPMLNSSGAYNINMISPKGQLEHFGTVNGLFPPPDDYSYQHWVDPTYYPTKVRKIFSNADSMLYQWGVLKFNFNIFIYCFSFFSYLKLGVFLLLIPALFIKEKEVKEKLIFYFLSALAVMVGYLMVLIEERYFLGAQLLFFIASYLTVFHYIKQTSPSNYKNWILALSLLAISISFMKTNYFSIKAWIHFKGDYIKEMVLYEKKIAQLPFIKNKKIATAYSHNEMDDLTCYEMWSIANIKNYGNLGKFDSYEKQYHDLKKYDIDYFLYYGCSKTDSKNNCSSRELPFYLINKKPVYRDTIYGVSIYSMKPY